MKRHSLLLVTILLSYTITTAQNILDTSTWTVSSGAVNGFSLNGTTTENSREYGTGPHNNSVLLWKASPDSANNADGGWNTDYHAIDHTKTYRFTVWLKKTNSNYGRTYFGCKSPNNILKLDESVSTNPYFWDGDLPQLNKWYLLVGYVHGSTYSSTINYGGIYDGTTGQKVLSITDFKFKTTAISVRHRAYLYWDTNTADKQYFYAPRLEKVTGSEPSIEELIGLNEVDQNLLDTSTWTIGSGSVAGFNQNGLTSENSRELGLNHVGDEVLLWKASPDVNGNLSGGWNSSYHAIDNTKAYRFSVWLKRTNSNQGHSNFGCITVLNLDNTINPNPYFWQGDFPKLNRWYLLVAYVHENNYTGSSQGKMYDGVTGEVVETLTDFKFQTTTNVVGHRAYLSYVSNVLDRQYFYEPRIDLINGNEPTINNLLHLNENSKLIVAYDNAGNQTQRFYCSDPDYCVPLASKNEHIEEFTSKDLIEEDPDIAEIDYVNQLQIYPNPTKDMVTVQLDSELLSNIEYVRLYNTNSSLLQELSFEGTNKVRVDLSEKPVGVYFIHIHLNDGNSITKKIIKY